MKIFKKATSLVMLLAFLLTFLRPLSVEAAPAPTLTRIIIHEMMYEDTTGEIYVYIEYVGRPSTASVICNGFVCPEDTRYRDTIFGSNNIEVGEVRFFKTPYTIDQAPGIHSYAVTAEAQTLRYPRQTIRASRILPGVSVN
ncbi:hypothetical protein [Pseudobutyrivibrio xylanivorans]|uniref:Uncharacterized protein n=1 Tax=Pseudobutyrivibrio xylanivorans DSM 14809 TaxID=1123012 RepID=A0A1M6LE49_PSEXY|nr:hypothetical protein [Pseudobutyrivibrio xylanivorans]SHJ69489.1 hypothetical protein SAMN02745725_03090 [Pseudobutyrivibrio xylanivorans DSM 14809]